jgi:hypothetical protein
VRALRAVHSTACNVQHAMRCSDPPLASEIALAMVVVVVDEMGHWEISGRVFLRPAPPVCLPLSLCFGPQKVSLSLIPTTWLLAPSYHFPPFPLSWGEGDMGSPSCGPPCSLSQICPYRTARFAGECRGGGGKGREKPSHDAGPGVRPSRIVNPPPPL